ncbi:MAG TPA: hypothetical protein VFF73_30865 [Planctomycetota bacterium]|nr:hypothetical protein [Planctomycetota bacterium]
MVLAEQVGFGIATAAFLIFLMTFVDVDRIADSENAIDAPYRQSAVVIQRVHYSTIPLFLLGLTVAALADQKRRVLGRQYHGSDPGTVSAADAQRGAELRAARLARGEPESSVLRGTARSYDLGDRVAQLGQVKKPFLVAAAIFLAVGVLGNTVHRRQAKLDAIIAGSYRTGGDPSVAVAAAFKKRGYDVDPADVQAIGRPWGKDLERTDVYVTVRSPRSGIEYQFKEDTRTAVVAAVGLKAGSYKDAWPVSALPAILAWAAMIVGFTAAPILGLLAFRA